MNDSIITVTNLSKIYGAGKGIKDISFQVQKGTIFGIAGLNGAGKTTLLSTIVGFLEKNSGSIEYNFMSHKEQNFHPQLLDQMGIVLREQGFPEHFTALMINNIMKSMYSSWNGAKFLAILNAFKINLKSKIKQYSTGMKSALSLAIALSHNSKLLVLDEAMDGLDVLARNKVRGYLKEFIKSGNCSVIFTTHEIEEVEKLADCILLIDNGRVLLNLSKEKMRKKYNVVSVDYEQYASVDKNDIIYAKKDESSILVLPKELDKFKYKYKIEASIDSMEKVFEMILEGNQNERINQE